MTRLLELAIALSVLLTGSALVSLMAVFMGFTGPGVDTLLALQAQSLPAAALFTLWPAGWFAWRYGRRAPAMLWRFLPGWLLFAWLLVNLLVLFGEISFGLVHVLAARPAAFFQHLPLLSGALGSLGATLGYAMHCALRASDANDMDAA